MLQADRTNGYCRVDDDFHSWYPLYEYVWVHTHTQHHIYLLGMEKKRKTSLVP